MANARQCDRCGKFYAVYTSDIPKVIKCKTHSGLNRCIYLDDSNNDIDLCDKCLNELNGWWAKIAHVSPANRANKESENDGS